VSSWLRRSQSPSSPSSAESRWLAFVAGRGSGPEGTGLGTDFSGYARIGDEVVIPVRVGRVASPGCKHSNSFFAEISIHHRVDPLSPAAGTDGVQQQQRCSCEWAADNAPVVAKLSNDPVVPIVGLFSRQCHGPPFGTGPPSSRPPNRSQLGGCFQSVDPFVPTERCSAITSCRQGMRTIFPAI
jgi:hypothetical protein